MKDIIGANVFKVASKEVDPLEQVKKGAALKDAKVVCLEPISDQLFCGEVRRVAEMTGVRPTRRAGYWLLKKDSKWAGEKAKPGEKTVLYMHGGAVCGRTPTCPLNTDLG